MEENMIKSYNNKEIEFNGCPGCAYGKHEFELDCGMAYENERFTVAQDFELPIPGFFIVSPKNHIEKLAELTDEERNEMFDIANKTVKILREAKICDRFDFIFEEEENIHLHLWILPRHEWMNETTDKIIYNIKKIFDYAKNNFRNSENYDEIKRITDIVKEEFTS